MSAPAETSDTRCAGCGKTVDALRAGSVAILGGRFRYYCENSCKSAHLMAIAGNVVSDDVATAEPPAVQPAASHVEAKEVAEPIPASGPQENLPIEASPSSSPHSSPLMESAPEPEPLSARPSPAPVQVARAHSSPESSLAPEPLAPISESPPTPKTAEVAPSSRPDFISAAGLVAGVLSIAVGLASTNAVRLPLAALAALAVVARRVVRPPDAADAHPAVAAVPIGAMLAAALWTASNDDPGAGALALLVGASASCVLAVDLVVARARRRVDAARARLARDLDVSVRVVNADGHEEVSALVVKPGERIDVEAGEVIGADGAVIAGEASVVPWLGASTEVTKREGDTVVAGARVVSGRLRLTVTWSAQDRAWARLALSPGLRVDVGAPIAKLARLLAHRGAPVAAALAGAAAFANGANPADVVAAACAAALACGAAGVAAMVALVHAEGHVEALGHGIVYKDAPGFDRAGRTDVAVVCARGTVLMGEPEIVALEALDAASSGASRRGDAIDEGRLIALAAGAETASTHPYAGAVLRGARARGEQPAHVRNATVHAGLGVTALTASGERLVVGNRAFLLQEKVSVAVADARVSALEAQGRSVLLVALGGKLVGLLALQDGLRPGARAAVQRLLDTRIEPVLLSGEARETCETIGRALDIEHVRPEVLPADRGAEVRALGEGGHVVAVLGHAASDDGALGAADVAIALGAAGSTPGEWTVQLASDDVRDAALALSLAHAARDKARRALAAGLAPVALAVLAIAFGVAPLAVAPISALVGTFVAARLR